MLVPIVVVIPYGTPLVHCDVHLPSIYDYSFQVDFSYRGMSVTRDTLGFALKSTYIELDGVGHAIYKDPKTDSGKKSARGLLRVDRDDSGRFILRDNVTPEEERGGELKEVFVDGKIMINESIADIRNRINSYL